MKVEAERDVKGCIKFTADIDHLFWDYYDFNAGTKIPTLSEDIGILSEDYLIEMRKRGMASEFFSKAEAYERWQGAGRDKVK